MTTLWALSTNGEFYPFTFGYQLAFNETITMQAGYNKKKIYSLVESGDWTWDVFLTICSKVTKDLDSDGILDQFGNTSWIFGAEILTNKTNPIYQDNTESGSVILRIRALLTAWSFCATRRK